MSDNDRKPAASSSDGEPGQVTPKIHLFWMLSFLVIQVAALSYQDWPEMAGFQSPCIANPASRACYAARAQQTCEIFSVIACICGGLGMVLFAMDSGAAKGIFPAGMELPDSLKRAAPIGLWAVAAVADVVAVTVWTGKFPKLDSTVFTATTWLGMQVCASTLAFVCCFSFAKDYRVWLAPAFLGACLAVQITCLSITDWPSTRMIKNVWCKKSDARYDFDNCKMMRAMVSSETFGTASAIVGGIAFIYTFVSALATSEIIPDTYELCKYRAVPALLTIVNSLFSLTAIVVLGGVIWHIAMPTNPWTTAGTSSNTKLHMFFLWMCLQVAAAGLSVLGAFAVLPIKKLANYMIPFCLLAFCAVQVAAVAMNDWPRTPAAKHVCDNMGKSSYECVTIRTMIATEAMSASAAIMGGFAFIVCLITALAKDEVIGSGDMGVVAFILCAVTFFFSLCGSVIYPAAATHYQWQNRAAFVWDNHNVFPMDDQWLRLQLASTAIAFAGCFCFLPVTSKRSFLVSAILAGFFATQVAALIEYDWVTPKSVTQLSKYCSGHPSACSCKVARAEQASESLGICSLLIGFVAWVLSMVNTAMPEKIPAMLLIVCCSISGVIAVLASAVWPATYKMHKDHLGLNNFNDDSSRYHWLELQITAAVAVGISTFLHSSLQTWRKYMVCASSLVFFTMQAAALSALANDWPWPRTVTHRCHQYHIQGEYNAECIRVRTWQAVETFGIVAAIFGGFLMIVSMVQSRISGMKYLQIILALCTAAASLLASVLPAGMMSRTEFQGGNDEQSINAQLQAVASVFAVLSVGFAALNTWSEGWIQPDEAVKPSGVQMS